MIASVHAVSEAKVWSDIELITDHNFRGRVNIKTNLFLLFGLTLNGMLILSCYRLHSLFYSLYVFLVGLGK